MGHGGSLSDAKLWVWVTSSPGADAPPPPLSSFFHSGVRLVLSTLLPSSRALVLRQGQIHTSTGQSGSSCSQGLNKSKGEECVLGGGQCLSQRGLGPLVSYGIILPLTGPHL